VRATLVAALLCVTTPALADPPTYKVLAPQSSSQKQTWTSGDKYALLGVMMVGSALLIPGAIHLTSGPYDDPDEEAKRKRLGWGFFIAGNLVFAGLLPPLIYSANQPKDPGSNVPNFMFAPEIGPSRAGLSAVGTF
jgi:hypothetical protein